jgi:nitroreductase
MAPSFELTADQVLSTTRAVRKRMDFDRQVDLDTIRECVELAIQAPTGSNQQGWHFVVVTDAARRQALADIYRRAFDFYRNLRFAAGHIVTGDPGRDATQQRVMSSAEYLAENMHRVPVHLLPCIEGRVDGQPVMASASVLGSIIPAAWSFCLAARARGLGTAWTTLHLMFEAEAAAVLGIPHASVSQVALIPVAHTLGADFRPGPRMPVDSVLHVDGW